MKNKIISLGLLSILGLSYSGLSFAGGHDSGNGEFLYACKKNKNDDQYRLLEIWDFYETRKYDLKYQVQREWQSSVYEQVNQAIAKMARVNPQYAEMVRSEFEFMIQPAPGQPYKDVKGVDLLEDLDPRLFENSWLQIVDGPLSPTNDTISSINVEKQNNCEKIQLVNYPEYLDKTQDPATLIPDQKIKIDRKLWKMTNDGIFARGYLLHKTDKAAVLLHEAIYKVERDYFNADDSKHTRTVVALLFQKGIENLDEVLATKLIPSDMSLFSESNFNYESLRKFFHLKGKFAAIESAELTMTQWDLYGVINRDGRNSLDVNYTPEKAVAPFAQGKRPKLFFLNGGQVFADSHFQVETCVREAPAMATEAGCVGRYVVDQSGQVGIGTIADNANNDSYPFPSVNCKLTFSRNVLICESLVRDGETFFSVFHRQTRKLDMGSVKGAYRFISELFPRSNVYGASGGGQQNFPILYVENLKKSLFNGLFLARGLQLQVPQESLVRDWQDIEISIGTHGLRVFLPFQEGTGLQYLDCLANPLADTLICTVGGNGVRTSAKLIFGLIAR